RRYARLKNLVTMGNLVSICRISKPHDVVSTPQRLVLREVMGLPIRQETDPTSSRTPLEVALTTNQFSLGTLIALVVGSMVGAGIFSLPRTFGDATGPFGALIAWCVAGTGMFMLARVFQTLAERKPDMDAGVYAYARAGFGDYCGFLSALGYWLGSCIGNVSYWVLIKSTLGAFFPVFGNGNTIPAVLVASLGI